MTDSGTGGGNTPVQNFVSSRIDWAGWTWPEGAKLSCLWEGGEPVEWKPAPGKGRYGYDNVWKWLGVELWTQHHNAGPHVDASGKGCRDIEQAATVSRETFSWQGWLEWLIHTEASFSRLDLAIDLRGTEMGVRAFADSVSGGHLVTRWKPGSFREMRGIGPGTRGGHTLYLGRPDSDAMLLVYDKGAEQGLPADDLPWTRVEMRCRAETAKAMARTIAAKGMKGGGAAMLGYVDFLAPDGARIPAWQQAMDGIDKSTLSVVRRGGTRDSMERWLWDDVAASLATLVDLHEGDMTILNKLTAEGRARYNAKHRSMITEDERAKRTKHLKGRDDAE